MSAETTRRLRARQPLRLARVCVEKPWGGRALERVPGIELAVDGPVGETLELFDGAGRSSRVLGGPLDGTSLHELLEADPVGLLGEAQATADGRFPIVVKLISAAQTLSVQVHPSDTIAEKLGVDEGGKTECWYVLAAEESSQLYLGLREDTDPAAFAASAESGQCVDMLRTWPVQAGDFVFVPSGTVHAIGAGITMVEVQNNADVTFRLYDWGRSGLDGAPREVHVAEALLATSYDETPAGPLRPELEPRAGGGRAARLVDCEAFGLELLELVSFVELETDGRAVAYVVVAGEGRIRAAEGGEGEAMATGDTWLVPAACGGHRLEPSGESLRVLRVETKA